MIASFNRVKSLTPDIAIVRDVMTVSSLLEVREDKVRLTKGESRRWVLPDAKSSTIEPDTLSAAGNASENVDVTSDVPGGLLELEGQAAPRFGPGDVENALMKSVPPSSSASILNGDDSMEKLDTPATSMSGDGKDEGGDTEVR